MRKPWKEQIKKANGKGYYYYVKWCEYAIKDGSRVYIQKSKGLRTKAEQDHYCKLLYHRLNSDVYTSPISVSWQEACNEFSNRYDTKGLASSSKAEALRTLKSFANIIGEIDTKDITIQHIDAFNIARQKSGVSKYTVRKDLSNLRTFINWLKENRYINSNIKVELIKVPQVITRIPSNAQLNKLLKSCPNEEWHMRILLSLVLGFRASDIDNLKTNAFDLDRVAVEIVEGKTGTIIWYPLPDSIKPLLGPFLEARSGYLFSTRSKDTLDKQLRKFRPENITRQALRKTNKTLLQRIGSIGSVKSLLHSDLRVTQNFYTDQELILKWKINQFPINEWLE